MRTGRSRGEAATTDPRALLYNVTLSGIDTCSSEPTPSFLVVCTIKLLTCPYTVPDLHLSGFHYIHTLIATAILEMHGLLEALPEETLHGFEPHVVR